jgi:hypothetical protein
MMRRMFRSVCVVACLALGIGHSIAQEGHPLVGSWHGNWGFSAADRKDLTLIIDYTADGAGITGVANPGYDHAEMKNPVLTITKPTDWNFKFELDLKDKAGKVTHYVADGKLDQIGYDQRTLAGTWTSGNQKGDFKLTRDRDYTR